MVATAAKTVAIVQSNYIPWKGYFDLIRRSDEFVLYDDVQYTRRDWRNRNRIKTKDGVQWLTIPVNVAGRYTQAIKDVVISEAGWSGKHWKTLSAAYARAPFFPAYRDRVERLYAAATYPQLSAVNRHFIEGLCAMLGVATPIRWSMEFDLPPERSERLLAICRQCGATRYLSGPAARAYLDVPMFEAAGVEVEFMSYEGYREYPQPHPPFDHFVTALDLIFCTGPEALSYMLPVEG